MHNFQKSVQYVQTALPSEETRLELPSQAEVSEEPITSDNLFIHVELFMNDLTNQAAFKPSRGAGINAGIIKLPA